MKNCRLLLMTGAVLAVLAMPALAVHLKLDVWGDYNTVQPGWYDTFEVAHDPVPDQSVTTAAGITVTLDGLWGGRNRGPGCAPDVPPDYTEHGLLRDHATNWLPLISEENPPERTVTISGLTPNTVYDTSVWAYENWYPP